MKKAFIVAILVSLVALFGAIVHAAPPADGNFAIAGEGGSVSGAPFSAKLSGNTIAVSVPYVGAQSQKEGTAAKDFKLHASMAVHKGGHWQVLGWEYNSYALMTSVAENSLCGILTLPKDAEGADSVWLRVWGDNADKSGKGKWLWIEQSDAFHRKDLKGKPGYEVIVNLKDGEVVKVPSTYQVRP